MAVCFEANADQARPPLAAIGASTINANVLVEANAASVMRTRRCLSELRSMVFSLWWSLSRNASSARDTVQVFGERLNPP